MSRNRKSPPEKKALEYQKDHFTFGWDSSRFFPKTWRRKKKIANRQYRRKSEAILAQNKVGGTAADVELLADDLTATRFQKSVSRKRLYKTGTVTLDEKIKRKLERRTLAQNRRSGRRGGYDQEATNAIRLLTSLEGKALEAAVLQADFVCSKPVEGLKRILPAKTPLDLALYFLYLVAAGSVFEIDALKRNPSLDMALAEWLRKANRILAHANSMQLTKMKQQRQTKEKIRAQRLRRG